MPRPKSYNKKEAIKLACNAFWAQGYQALGVRELETLTGLNQFAIRSEFGGKEGLYLEALKFYSDKAISTAMVPLKDGSLPEIILFLKSLVLEGSVISSPWGCLIVNTGVENARVGSPKLDQATRYYWDTLEYHFCQSLANARKKNEISRDLDLKATALALVTGVMGVHARNRMTKSYSGGQDLVKFMCVALEEKVRS